VNDERVRGTVVRVSSDSIEILPADGKESLQYSPHELLASGAVCHWVTDSECYLLDDVRAGDEVLLGVGTVDKENGTQCFYVSIRKRPDGKIPPSRKPNDLKPYHLTRQRELDHEARGEPLPEDVKAAEDKKKLTEKRMLLPPGTDPNKKD
jgi:hypothetical protein